MKKSLKEWETKKKKKNKYLQFLGPFALTETCHKKNCRAGDNFSLLNTADMLKK